MRQEGLHREKDAGHVHREGLGPCGGVVPGREIHVLVAVDAGVADQQVDGPARKPIRQRADRGRVADIEGCVGARAGRRDDLRAAGPAGVCQPPRRCPGSRR